MRNIYLILLASLFLFPLAGHSQVNRLKEGSVLYEKYHYIDAQKVYEKVVERGYKSAAIYGDLADSYYYQSKYKEAAGWYELLLDEYPTEVTESQYLRAIQSLKSDEKYDRATELLELYKDKFGKSSIAKHYDKDPNYLESIRKGTSIYSIERLGINTEGSDHAPSFLGDTKVVFASSDKHEDTKTHSWDGGAFLDLFVADRDTNNGRLRNKQPIEGNVNTGLHESSSVFTKDGKTMYFTRNNIRNGKGIRDNKDVIRVRIFKAELQDDETWQVVEDLPINGNDFSTGYPALNKAEDKLYFSSDRPGTIGMSDIWFVDIYADGTYGYPTHLGEGINTEGREAFLFIDDQDVLYFASDGHLGLGGLDIFKTKLNQRGMASEIKNIGKPFNSPQDDFSYIIDLANNEGYFATNREEGGSINDDIYYFYYECVIKIQGVLRDIETHQALNAGEVLLLDDNNNVLSTYTVDADGKYFFEVECGEDYLLEASNFDYEPKEISLHTPATSGVVSQDLLLEKLPELVEDDLGSILSLRPIYFDYNDYKIVPIAELELIKISEAMKMYPDLVVYIESHTDSRGGDAFNLNLSDLRAKATMQWLIKEGEIDASRLQAQGFGRTQLVNECADGVECTEKQHALNRRSNFIIQD